MKSDDNKKSPINEFSKPTDISIKYKFNEGVNIKEFSDWIDSTYGKDYHYVGENSIQAFDVWHSRGIDGAEATHANTAIKYLMRYGKKHGYNRNDLLKAMHFILMLLYYNDLRCTDKKENKKND